MTNKKSILFLGSYGRGNLGDDMFLEVILNKFPNKNFNIYINASQDAEIPAEYMKRISIIDTDFSSGIQEKMRVFKKIDTIVYFGGDLFVELIGAKFHRIVFYKMLLVNALAKLTGKKVFYLGVGVGNIKGFSLLLARTAGKLSNYIVFRDNTSAKKLNLNNNKFTVLPDIAINYFKSTTITLDKKTDKKIRVGISLLYFIPDKFENFPKLLESISNLINSNKDIDFTFLPLFKSKNEKNDDLWVGNKLIEKCEFKNIKILEYTSIGEYIQKIQKFDVIISARLHGSILSILSGIPTISLSYSPKVTNFFSENNLEKYCIDITNIKNLENILLSLIQNKNNILFENTSKNLLGYSDKYDSVIKKIF